MKNCLEKILCGELIVIGIRDYVGCDHPLSKLFIQQIPGISLKKAAAIATPEQESGAALLRESILTATQFVANDFKRLVQPLFSFNAIIENANECVFGKGLYFWPPAALNRGLKISRIDAPLSRIKIRNLYIRVVEAGAVTLKIEDGNDVYNYNLNLEAGMNNITLNKVFKREEVFVTMDNTNFQTSQGICKTHCSTCTGSSKKSNIHIEGWNGTAADYYTYGIRADVQLICDDEELFCMCLDRLYWMILYKSAELVFDNALTTNRLNNVSTFGKELAGEKVEEYALKYEEERKQVGKSLTTFLKSFRDICLTCKGIKNVYQLPG